MILFALADGAVGLTVSVSYMLDVAVILNISVNCWLAGAVM